MPYSNIDKPSSYFTPKTYAGTGATQSITGLGFQPDWVWFKDRTNAYGHDLYDSARGATYRFQSNDTGEESLTATGLTSFDSDGFSMGGFAGQNSSGANYISWCWKANGTGVSNTSGSITSTVSANTTSGFSIVTYTGNGTNGATIGHGLGVAPKMVIPKCRSHGSTDWSCYHASLSSSNNIFLNLTQGQNPISNRNNGGISPVSSTTFTVAQGDTTLNSVNATGRTYIAYCFAEIKGFSKISSYTGNGSADGTFVYTGFKPAFVIIKRSDTSGYGWYMFDNKRNTFNPEDKILEAQSTTAEYTGTVMDFTSNGFKLRNSGSDVNPSGGTIIYMAFAENPFVSSKGIPTTAR